MVSKFFLSLLFSHSVIAGTIGNPDAPVGGNLRLNLMAEPSGLNPLKGTDGYSSAVTSLVFDSLLARNIDTFQQEPGLAEKYEVAKDGMSITFTLRGGVTFHDGTPLTVEDVEFSFNASRDPKLSDPVRNLFFENFDRVEIVDQKTIKFHIKKKYFKNLDVVGGFEIVPKLHYSSGNKKMNKTMVGSGPYQLESYKQGQRIVLKRNDKWWGYQLPHLKGYYKFDRMTYVFIKDTTAQLESFKKNELDFIGLTPENYIKKTDGPMWGTKVKKVEVENKSAKGYTFIAFNLRKTIFKDIKVREAMSELFNRELMIEKFFYGKYLAATGPWYVQSPFADPNVKAVKYNPKSAGQKLKSSGWSDTDKDGILDKLIDGKKTDFRISMIHPGGEWEKYLTIYKEELKKSGIDLILKQLEWNAFQKNLNDWSFDLVGLAWGGVVENDPKQIWHSASITKEGSNFAGYSNSKVDELIDRAREEMNYEKRKKALQQIYATIAADHPYMFLFVPKYGYYAHNAKIEMVKPTYNYSIGRDTWWFEK